MKKKLSTAGSSLTHTGNILAGVIAVGILPSFTALQDAASWTALWVCPSIRTNFRSVIGDELRLVSASLRRFRQQRRLDFENHHHLPEIQQRVNLTACVRQVDGQDLRPRPDRTA